jgi:hypothetical protein
LTLTARCLNFWKRMRVIINRRPQQRLPLAACIARASRFRTLKLQEDEAAVVEQWLAAAQLAQVGMDRLVGTLELIEGEHRDGRGGFCSSGSSAAFAK